MTYRVLFQETCAKHFMLPIQHFKLIVMTSTTIALVVQFVALATIAHVDIWGHQDNTYACKGGRGIPRIIVNSFCVQFYFVQ